MKLYMTGEKSITQDISIPVEAKLWNSLSADVLDLSAFANIQ